MTSLTRSLRPLSFFTFALLLVVFLALPQSAGAELSSSDLPQGLPGLAGVPLRRDADAAAAAAAEAGINYEPRAAQLDDPPVQPIVPLGDDGYEKEKIFFELDLTDYKMPSIDIDTLRRRPPHNYKGAGNPTYGLFFMSRNSSLHDPYFLATMQVIYRVLWKEDTKSLQHPITVFVPPWVGDVQRSWFQAIGAVVRDVPERPFHPDSEEVGGLISHRFKDVFSKLDMWSHIEFTRVLFLDSDAFPLVNIDALLEKDMAPEQQCKPSLMFKDHPVIGSDSSICQYVFAGAQDLTIGYMTNVGVMVFKPNRAMHDILIRQYTNSSLFIDGWVEQAFLSYIFREEGPFPVSRIDKAYNGDPQVKDSGHDLFVVHAKLWAVMFEDPNHWAGRLFWDTWANLTTLYQSQEFRDYRAEDGPLF